MTSLDLSHADLAWLARLARALIGDAAAAEDLAQETAVAVLRRPAPAGASPRAWLGAVARRLAARHFRGEARRRDREARASAALESPDTSDLVERAELAEEVIGAVRRLDEPQRRTVLLRFLEGLETSEIARLEDVPADTVRWRLRKGLARLRDELAADRPGGHASLGALLLPLTRVDHLPGATGPVTPMALTGPLLTGTLMKAAALAVAALLGAFLFVSLGRGSETEPPARGARSGAAEPAPRSAAGDALESVPSLAARAEDAPAEPPTATDARDDAPGLHGVVTTLAGAPIADATVYLLAAGSTSSEAAARVTTDRAGTFRFDPAGLAAFAESGDAEPELGVHANGFLRRVVPDAIEAMPTGGWRLELEGGGVLVGRVVDTDGRAVPDLRLVAFTAGGGVGHVSPSQRERRSSRKVIAGSTSTYFECRARTDAAGNVRFSGLATGRAEVLSLDPGWVIQGPAAVEAGGGAVTWTAASHPAVRVTVIDGATGARAETVKARFWADVALDDGATEPFGKWVGRGDGEVSFTLATDLLPDLGGRRIVSVSFRGEVQIDDRKAAWRTAPLAGAAGVAELSVTVPPGSSSPEETPAAAATSVLELDVRYDDGSTFPRVPVVRWAASSGAGPERTGEATPREDAPGRFVVEVPAGRVDLRISDPRAQGSLAPWVGRVDVAAGGRELVGVTLPRGGEVRIVRPDGYEGEWFTHASWRLEGEEEWRGSWNYSTDGEELELTAMRRAEWRFRLSQAGREDVVRTAFVEPGASTIVDRGR